MSETTSASTPRRLGNAGRYLASFWGVALLILFWEAFVAINGFNSIVMPHPWSVLVDLVTHPGVYVTNGAQTLVVALVGTGLGMALGTLIAVLSWLSPVMAGMLTPLGMVFSSVPVIAVVPIIARLLGYDVRTTLAIVVVITFFPAYVFTGAGLRALPPGSDDLFRVLGSGRWTRLRHLALPAAVPNWMIAFRLGAANAVLAAIVAEFTMGTTGLGNLFRESRVEYDMARALGASAVATIIAVIAFLLAITAERLVRQRWE